MLLSLTLAFLAGLVIGAFLPYLPCLLLILVVVAGVGLTGLERLGRIPVRQGMALYGALLVGALYWTAYAWMENGPRLEEVTGNSPVRVTGRIVQPVGHAPARMVLVLSIMQLGEEASARLAEGRVRLTWRDPDLILRQGDVITLMARLRPPSGTLNPGGFDYEAHLRRQGIDAVATLSGPGQITVLGSASGSSRWAAWRVIDGWRERIGTAALATLSGPALGIYLGIIIGQPGYLTPDVRDVFMATGTVHILSISGSHLGLIALLSFFLVKRTCRRLPATWLQSLSRRVTATRLAAVATTIPVTFYTLLAGAEVATVRSLIMIVIFLLALWLGRQEQVLLALASAALVILLHDPRALFDISFQLSYCSVLAIALVLRYVPDNSGSVSERAAPESVGVRLWTWLRLYGWITGGVTLATIPFVAHYFNQIAWLGLVANLLVVPLAGIVLVPLGLGSALWVLLTGRESLPVGMFNQTLLDLLVGLVRLLARVPGAEWHVASPALLAIGVFYAMLVVAVRSEQARWLRRTCLVGVALLVGWWGWSPRVASDGDTLRVTFLDVGQGDACVIELPDGQTVLIDAGTSYETLDMGRAVVGPYLWDRGIRRVDHVIGTHPQLDHVGGLAWVLRSFEVGQYWSNGIGREEFFYQRLRDVMQARGLTESVAAEGETIISSGPCRLFVLNPPRGLNQSSGGAGDMALRRSEEKTIAKSGSLLNNLSVVTRLDCGPQTFLFTADIEANALRALNERSATAGVRVLKVPHHGARSSLDEAWVARVRPEVAVISVGRHNPYGHPAAEVLAAYKKSGAQLYRTDQQGAVWITASTSSSVMQAHFARESLLQPVPLGASPVAVERDNLSRIWRQWAGAS